MFTVNFHVHLHQNIMKMSYPGLSFVITASFAGALSSTLPFCVLSYTGIHSTIGFASTTSSPGSTVTGTKATSGGINRVAGNRLLLIFFFSNATGYGYGFNSSRNTSD